MLQTLWVGVVLRLQKASELPEKRKISVLGEMLYSADRYELKRNDERNGERNDGGWVAIHTSYSKPKLIC